MERKSSIGATDLLAMEFIPWIMIYDNEGKCRRYDRFVLC